MSTSQENKYIDTKQIEYNTKKKPGRKKMTEQEAIQKYEERREKAKERYYQNKDTCAEQSKNNSKRIHELYKEIKELFKKNQIILPEDKIEKIKELLLLS